jgi:hypothetical protein
MWMMIYYLSLFSMVIDVIISSNPNRFSASRFRLLQSSSNSSASFATSIAKLTASNGGINNYFGQLNGVSISNHRIVVGALGYDGRRGAAYVFGDPKGDPPSGRDYTELAILMAMDGEIGDSFGDSVAMDGDTIVVGAVYASFGGVVYVYRFNDDIANNISITQMAKLTASNGLTGDDFGESVAIYENYISVGAPYVTKNTSFFVGSAYIFGNPSNDPNDPQWTQLTQFQPNDLAENDYFGTTLAMDDHIVIIGTVDANAAYVYEPVNNYSSSFSSSWTQTAKLTGVTDDNNFGSSVAVAGKSWVRLAMAIPMESQPVPHLYLPKRHHRHGRK